MVFLCRFVANKVTSMPKRFHDDDKFLLPLLLIENAVFLVPLAQGCDQGCDDFITDRLMFQRIFSNP